MTFVAQPYARFADDLLTALTGGIIREEHRFVGVESPYALAHPAVVVESLRVYGQRGEAYTEFARGVEYRYDADEQAILWQPEAALPDDRSYFYVNYSLPEARPRLTDRSPGSVVNILSGAFAREFAVLHQQMEGIYRAGFIETAEDVALDQIAALLDIRRKDARFAQAEVLFTRTTPAPGDISVAAGTVVSTSAGLGFETTDKRTLRKGQLSIAVPVRAQVEGPVGKVDAKTITTVNRPIFGIEGVVNEQASYFATERESDEVLRRRIQGTLERAGRATLDAIKFRLIEEVPQLNETNVQVEEGATPGQVAVRLGLEGTPDAELISRVEAALLAARPAGIRVSHTLGLGSALAAPVAASPVARPQVLADMAAAGAPAAAATLDGAAEAATLPLQVEILLRMAGPTDAAAQEKLNESVRAAVVDYVHTLPMGATIVYNKLLARIVAPDEVADAELLVQSEGSSASAYHTNLETGGRKATLSPESVFIERMEQAVRIDLRILLAPAPSNNGASPLLTIPDPLKATLRTACVRVLDAGSVLRLNDLRAAIVAALAGEPFILAEGSAVILNADYEETGRLMNGVEMITLQAYERAQLRTFGVELPGVLDG